MRKTQLYVGLHVAFKDSSYSSTRRGVIEEIREGKGAQHSILEVDPDTGETKLYGSRGEPTRWNIVGRFIIKPWNEYKPEWEEAKFNQQRLKIERELAAQKQERLGKKFVRLCMLMNLSGIKIEMPTDRQLQYEPYRRFKPEDEEQFLDTLERMFHEECVRKGLLRGGAAQDTVDSSDTPQVGGSQ